MIRYIRHIALLEIILLVLQLNATPTQKPYLTFPAEHMLKISYGSCNRFYETDKSIIFDAIGAYKPDIFAWLGDVAYVEDMIIFYAYFEFPGIEKARQRLESSKNDPSYAKFRKTIPIVGVWDNHDYGMDGGAKEFAHKYEMKDAFLDFLDEPKDSPRRNRSGVYESYTLQHGDLRINIVLLDVRFNKDTETGDILGPEQWTWLEEEFQKGDDLYLIGSGSQILPEDRILHDNWSPESTKRLLKLLKQYNISSVLLTGDVHLAEIIPLPCSKDILGYQLYEITSSGLTHTSRDHFYKGELFDKLFFPETYNKGEERFVDWNFGTIEIDVNTKDKSQSKLRFHIRDVNGTIRINKELILADLQRKEEPKVDIDSFTKSMCFNDSIKEERFFNHIKKVIFTKDIFFWVLPPVLGVIAIFSIIIIVIIKLCRPKKLKVKTQ